MRKIIISLFILLTSWTSYLHGQEVKIESVQGNKYLVHTVSSGETMYSISKKYGVSESFLKKNNAFALRDGLKSGANLYIPFKPEYEAFINASGQVQNKPRNTTAELQNSGAQFSTAMQGKKYLVHTAFSGETLYSLSKKYNVSKSDIENINAEALRNGLKAGTKLFIPYVDGSNTKNKTTQNPTNTPASQGYSASVSTNGQQQANLQKRIDLPRKINLIIHTVARKETLSSISRHYNIPVNDIIKYNPDINPAKKLRRKTKLTIPQYTTQQEDENYFYSVIKKQETPYSYSRIYNISVDDIFKSNPHISSSRFPVGEVIRIPKNLSAMTQNTYSILKVHTVESKETLYSISRKYNCTEKQLLAINKHLENGVKAGAIIYVPSDYSGMSIVNIATDNADVEQYISMGGEDAISISDKTGTELNSIICFNKQLLERLTDKGEVIYLPKKGAFRNDCFYKLVDKDLLLADCRSAMPINRTINVAVFLPLSGSVERAKAGERFFRFYDGFLLAVDSLEKEGAKIHTYFIDDEQALQKGNDRVDDLKLKDFDLFVGPMHLEAQGSLSSISKTNNIPMVSPFVYNQTQVSENNMFYNTTPSRPAYITMLARYIKDGVRNINLISINGANSTEDTDEYKVFKLLKAELPAGTDINESSGSYIEQFLKKDKANIILISSTDEAKINLSLTYLNRMSARYDIRIISTYDYDRYGSLQREYLHNAKFTYISPYFLDFNSELAENVVNSSRNFFSYEPDNYNLQGFDVGYFFMSAIYKYGKNFTNCLKQYSPKLTQGDYKFEKDARGYTNSRLQIIEYSQDFEKRVIGTIDEQGIRSRVGR